MALISDATNSWSTPVTLTSDEIWQVRKGSVFLTTEASPAADDGLNLSETQAVQLPAGTAVRYRKTGDTVSLIVREAV